MLCQFESIGQRGDLFVHKCRVCKREAAGRNSDPAKVKRMCRPGAPRPAKKEPGLNAGERRALEAAGGAKLAGDWLADLFSAVGVPPCGGCQKRKEWLNAGHRWILDRVSQLRQDS